MRKAIFSVFFSNVTGAGFGFLVNVVLARLLDVSSFGRINLLFSLITILYTVADFGYCNCLVIYYNRHRDSMGATALHQVNRLYLRFLTLVAVLGLPVLLLVAIIYRLTIQETSITFASFMLFSMYRYMTALHQAVGDWPRFNLLTVLNNVLKFILVMAAVIGLSRFYHILSAYDAALWGYLLYSVLLFTVCTQYTRPLLRIAPPFSSADRKEFLAILYPIGIAGIFIIITMRFDSLLIERYLGSEQLGIYAAANTLALVFPLLTGSLMNVLLRESAGDKHAYLVRVMANQKKYIAALGALLAISWLLSAPAIKLLFGEAYHVSADVFRILLIAYIGGVFFTPLESYYYANHPKTILYMRFVQMLVAITASSILILNFQLAGVAAGVVISRVIAWVYFYVNSSRIASHGGGQG